MLEKVLSNPKNSLKSPVSHQSSLGALETTLKKVLLTTLALELAPLELSKSSKNF